MAEGRWLEQMAGGRWRLQWWLEGGGRRMVVQGAGGLVWWRIATEPNRNSAILAIHTQLNTAYVSVSTEPPDYNHGYRRKPETLNPEAPV